MIIQRNYYLNKLIKKKHNGLVKIITGLRRSGKSYLLFTLFYNHLLESGVDHKHIITLSLDELANDKYRNIDNLRQYIYSFIKDDEMYYILLDEVQFAIDPNEMKNGGYCKLYGLLNEFLHSGHLDVYITGSNSRFLSSDIQTEFRGRGDELRIYPLTFKEFLPSCDKDTDKAFEEYCYFGGMPYIATQKDEETKQEYLKKLLKLTYINDIVERNNLNNAEILNDLLNILASSIGSLTNPSKLVRAFASRNVKTNAVTIKNYLKLLEDSFLISSAYRFDIKGKLYLTTPLKYYFADVGLRNAQLNFRQNEPSHILENVIYNELLARGYNVDVGIVPIQETINNKRTLNTYEVDFVCNKFDKRYYIQSALTLDTIGKLEQETQSFRRIEDGFEKIIITKDKIKSYINEDGYKIVTVIDFLLDENFLK